MQPPTIFLDIDGTILKYQGKLSAISTHPASILPGVLEKLDEWEGMGCQIILTTGRKESLRRLTEQQLTLLGIFYDQLIMGIGGGPRHLVNDKKPDGRITAFAHNVERDGGLGDVNV